MWVITKRRQVDNPLPSGIIAMRGCSSAVERQLPKLNVMGSSPITRSCPARAGRRDWIRMGSVSSLFRIVPQKPRKPSTSAFVRGGL